MQGTSIRPEDKSNHAAWGVPVAFVHPGDQAAGEPDLAARDRVVSWFAPTFGYVHAATFNLIETGTGGGPTLVNIRNVTLAVDLFAAGNRPSLAQAGANTPGRQSLAAAVMQNRDFNAGDEITLDVDAVATAAAGLQVTLWVVLGKRAADTDLPGT